MNTKHRKLLNAALGLAAGIVTLPLAVVLWPLGVAVFAWRETDGEDAAISGGAQDGGAQDSET